MNQLPQIRPAYINGIAYALPDQALTNDRLHEENPDWDMEKLASKIGIRERRIAASDETASDFGFRAAEKLIGGLSLDPKSIDVLLYCTQSPDYALPATACLLQHRLGLPTTCAALDFNQGCSGYVYGLYLAKGLVSAGMAGRVLLITAETYSKYIHPRDRSVRVIFGDAGAATLVSSEAPGAAIDSFELGTDGSGGMNLVVPAGGARVPRSAATCALQVDENGSERTQENLYMDGGALFTFTLKRVPDILKGVLRRSGLSVEQVDWFIFHQANAYMNEALRTKLKLAKERVPMCLEDFGNTVSSTLPITLCSAGKAFQPHQRVMLLGFGVGYSWGGCMLDWDNVFLSA